MTIAQDIALVIVLILLMWAATYGALWVIGYWIAKGIRY